MQMKNLQKIEISSKKIRLARIKRGLKQDELGRLINITGSAISIYERSNQIVKIDTANKLCNALDCKLSDIIEDNETDNNMTTEIVNTKTIEELFKTILELTEESKIVLLEVANRLKKLENGNGKTQNVGNIQNSSGVSIVQN